MKLQFEQGRAGFDEATEVLALVRLAREEGSPGAHDQALLDSLERAARGWLARPEYDSLAGGGSEAPLPARRGLRARLRAWLGPSRRELDLAAQRAAALERAARAERSAFEALAESARAAQERDEALARLRAHDAPGAADSQPGRD